jgi:TPR repeat protein
VVDVGRLALLLALIAVPGGAVAQAWPIDAPDDFSRAFAAASRGEPQAALAVADAYRLGSTVTADYLAAERWYARAARAGNVRAATELGLLHIEQKQMAAALPWLDHAARRGDPRAIGALATLYFNDRGIPPDRPLAYALTARSAQTGLAAAQAQLKLLDAHLAPADIAAAGDRLRRWDAEASIALPVSTEPPLMPATPAWQVQIAAFRSAAAAQAGWPVLLRRLRLDPESAPLLVPAGVIVRLRLPAESEDAAYGLCRHIRAARGRCVAFPSQDGVSPTPLDSQPAP